MGLTNALLQFQMPTPELDSIPETLARKGELKVVPSGYVRVRQLRMQHSVRTR
jgi:hypothetical protein